MARLKNDKEVLMTAGDELPFELAAWIDTAPFEDLVGITIESASAGRAILSFPFRLKLSQGGGVLHGGALTTLADTAVAMAIKSILPAGTVFATTDLSMQFVAPVHEGVVRAMAQVTGPFGRNFSGTAEIFDQAGKTIALFTSTFKVARGQGFADEDGLP